jgi:hypothetical protein
VSRLLDLVSECDGKVRARDVSVPVVVSDEDVGAEAEGAGLRPRVMRAEPERRQPGCQLPGVNPAVSSSSA